ncbi:HAD-IIIC family phosphatase [Pseudomonas savastanoi pv. phaseolicola]|uniref:HAD-IIIC family phosphatase n=1 Tax=Pseudomonas savastanoi TaxID=29438 RepID=UPI00031DFB39|nr:HAD-IIIC family phosphatase [Pseudomonas savastanoi]MBN3471252.1 HAD-IIIC family phosphatase [Pseudomonas savastanoi pv. phaseolicola]MBN3478134.1 HAD-IIIC family phosphatase [Pseudomonas savastanoi pv. phaseolicola]RMO17830.1 FkbH like protein [Pseudomonas savastanoi pv. phaseolicola]
MSELKKIKCVIWDLDETLWHGVLVEEGGISLKDKVLEIIQELDRRGILQSVASKNDSELAMKAIERHGLADYFLFPHINWGSKAHSLDRLSEQLNLSLDTFLFVDDQAYERDEVKAAHPMVRCMDAAEYLGLLTLSALMPNFITEDSALRRMRYQEQQRRDRDEQEFRGPSEAFLASLNMEMVVSVATEQDLRRAEELTIRTNQLNATGVTYGYDELDGFRDSPDHRLLVCELTDIYGSYGKIGLLLFEHVNDTLCIKMLLVSCRVMSRGIGSMLLIYAMKYAESRKLKLVAEYRPTGRNRIMEVTYGMANFKTSGERDDTLLLVNDLDSVPNYPAYLKIITPADV